MDTFKVARILFTPLGHHIILLSNIKKMVLINVVKEMANKLKFHSKLGCSAVPSNQIEGEERLLYKTLLIGARLSIFGKKKNEALGNFTVNKGNVIHCLEEETNLTDFSSINLN